VDRLLVAAKIASGRPVERSQTIRVSSCEAEKPMRPSLYGWGEAYVTQGKEKVFAE
jgi:hypothetical protein